MVLFKTLVREKEKEEEEKEQKVRKIKVRKVEEVIREQENIDGKPFVIGKN
jgi:hypothetical protein